MGILACTKGDPGVRSKWDATRPPRGHELMFSVLEMGHNVSVVIQLRFRVAFGSSG